MEMPFSSNTRGIARIVKLDGKIVKHVGMAIIVDARHVMTCCHVLNLALGRDPHDLQRPHSSTQFLIRFPYASNAEELGRVVEWGFELPRAKDVAVLELIEKDAPEEAGVAAFTEIEVQREKWSCNGWAEYGAEREVRGELGMILSKDERQMNGPDGTIAPRIVSGYSGAAVWCDKVTAFVGMVVTKDYVEFQTGLAYAIPTGVLLQVWPKLEKARAGPEKTAPPAPNAPFQPSRLPFGGEFLIGRSEELTQLNEAWEKSKGGSHILNIVGWGGVGKTALVRHWRGLLSHDRQYRGAELVLDWSFSNQGSSGRENSSAKAFVDFGLKLFENPAENQTKQDSKKKRKNRTDANATWNEADSEWTRGATLGEHLRRWRTLLILDGMEPLQHATGRKNQTPGCLRDHSLRGLLMSLAEPSDKGVLCIITTREPVGDLAGLAGAETIRLAAIFPSEINYWWYGAFTCVPTVVIGECASLLFPAPPTDRIRGLLLGENQDINKIEDQPCLDSGQ